MKYTINPITVDAHKIIGVGDRLSGGSVRVLLEGGLATSCGTVVKQSEMMGVPKVGDYLVTNEDGTRNVVPKAPFEATHTVVEQEPQDETLGEMEAADGAEENVEETPSEAELRAEGEEAENQSEDDAA